jgi:hypothetical protein
MLVSQEGRVWLKINHSCPWSRSLFSINGAHFGSMFIQWTMWTSYHETLCFSKVFVGFILRGESRICYRLQPQLWIVKLMAYAEKAGFGWEGWTVWTFQPQDQATLKGRIWDPRQLGFLSQRPPSIDMRIWLVWYECIAYSSQTLWLVWGDARGSQTKLPEARPFNDRWIVICSNTTM